MTHLRTFSLRLSTIALFQIIWHKSPFVLADFPIVFVTTLEAQGFATLCVIHLNGRLRAATDDFRLFLDQRVSFCHILLRTTFWLLLEELLDQEAAVLKGEGGGRPTENNC